MRCARLRHLSDGESRSPEDKCKKIKGQSRTLKRFTFDFNDAYGVLKNVLNAICVGRILYLNKSIE